MQQWRSQSKTYSQCYKLCKERTTNVKLKTVDNDIVNLCLTYPDVVMPNGIKSFPVVYGLKDMKIDIIDNFKNFSISVCKGLAFFHAVTWCDTVSSFCKVRKVKFLAISLTKIKAGDTTLSNIFKKFSNCSMNIKVNEFDMLCNFVYKACGFKKQAPFKTQWTYHLVSMPNVKLRMLVPSPSGILQHIKWACIQVGSFWKLSETETNIFHPTEWSCKPLPDGSLVPHSEDKAVTDSIKPVQSNLFKKPLVQDTQCWVCPCKFPNNCYSIRQPPL